jgi:hypothetical protein
MIRVCALALQNRCEKAHAQTRGFTSFLLPSINPAIFSMETKPIHTASLEAYRPKRVVTGAVGKFAGAAKSR